MQQDSLPPKSLHRAILSVPSLWAATLKNERGLTIDFDKRKFLIDMYNDLSPLQVVLKPPQIGATVMYTLKSLWVAKMLNRQIIYTLPTQSDIQDMVGGSINRIIAQNKTLMEWVKDHDTVEQKQVGDSMIFYRGTFTAKQAMMIPSGLNIHDEVDASNAEVITQYETRLQAQEDGGMRWYFSHPSRKGAGVDIYWEQSDKKEWFITCPLCKHEQYLTWPDNIDFKSEEYMCSACKGILTDQDRIRGVWKATSNGEFSGYHVSQLMLYNKRAKDIIEAYNDPMKTKQYFYNYVLGLPYAGGDDTIPSSEVLKNVKDIPNHQEDRVIIGVDTGLPYYYVLMNQEGVFHFNTCDGTWQLEQYLKHWPRSIVVSDAQGDLTPIRELQQKFPGRVFLGYLTKIQKSQQITRWGEKDEWGKVQIDRNRMFQLMVEWLRDGNRIVLNGTKEEWTPFAQHFDHVYREKLVVNETPGKDDKTLYGNEYVWKRSGPDHLCFALLFALVGFDKFGTMPEVVTGSGEEWLNTLKIGRIV